MPERTITHMHALTLLSAVDSTGAIPPSRIKDIKTAINKLAQACQLPPDELDLASVEATYPDLLKTYFDSLGPSVSSHTIRNTLQNLGQLYRAAHASLLIADTGAALRSRVPTQKQAHQELQEHSPHRRTHAKDVLAHYGLPVEQWPPDIAQAWQGYAEAKTIEVRQITMACYLEHLLLYVGYNVRHDPFPPSRWDELFEIPRMRRFIAWKAARVGAERITVDGKRCITFLVDIAKELERPDYAALYKFKRKLPRPAATVNKQAPRHTVSLVALDQLGLTLMAEARQPGPRDYHKDFHPSRPGWYRAVKFTTGLIIRLLTRCPRRQKEIREMDFGGRLYQDDRGTWQLHYQSHQLKNEMHNKQPNEFRMEWPPDLVDDLTEYLQVFRPMLLGNTESTLVFPTCRGRMISDSAFWERIALNCWARLHKHVFPHLFRTLWCDAYLDAHPGDFEGAAAMLNDTEQTVRNMYRQFRAQQQLKKGTDFNAQLFGHGHSRVNGKGTSRTPLV
jgi:hypothetical protein